VEEKNCGGPKKEKNNKEKGVKKRESNKRNGGKRRNHRGYWVGTKGGLKKKTGHLNTNRVEGTER